jgi:predicted O-methyltransferase YrrM
VPNTPIASKPSQQLLTRIAASLDVPTAALPLLPELFAHLDALGTSPKRVARWFQSAGVNESHHLIDMGCGKGASAIAVARACGCRITGVDAFAPFIQSAVAAATAAHVADRCNFITQDIHTCRPRQRFSAGMMLSLLPALEGIAFMRKLITPGGLLIIDDAVRTPREPPADDLPQSLKDLCEAITSQGDRVLRTHTMTPREVRALDANLYTRIARQARTIAARHPRSKPILREILRRQQEASTLLTGPIRPALLLIQLRNTSRS